jgi:nucleoside-diphosphate-sugar epimerase
MRLFITGANGYIGRNFIKYAAKKNNKIFAVTRRKKNKKIPNVKWLVGEIDKEWKELKKSDLLIHFATVGAYDKFTKLKDTFDFNVSKSINLIFNAANNSCKKWLIISTNKEKKIDRLLKSKVKLQKKTHEPHFNYALTKYMFSRIVLILSTIFNAKCRIVKLFHVYGNDENKKRLWPLLLFHSKKNLNLNMTAGHQTYDFSHIDNVVKSLYDCANFNKKKKKFPQEWDLATGKSMSVKDFAKKIWRKNNSKAKIFFSKIKNFDKDNYLPDKKKLWKVKYKKI